MRVTTQDEPSPTPSATGQLSIIPLLSIPTMSRQSRYTVPPKTLHKFPRLPCEVRWIIWQLSVEPRTIELEWEQSRGFYSRSATPCAMRVNRDSRNAISHLYTNCFGNSMVPPRTPFNFKIDVLLLSEGVQSVTLLFFSSLTQVELTNLQHIAIIEEINLDAFGCDTDHDSVLALSQIIPRLSSLKTISVAHDLEHNYEGNYSSGVGPAKIYDDRLPDDFHHECGPLENWLMNQEVSREGCWDAEDTDLGCYEDELYPIELINEFPHHLCDCNDLPDVPSEFEIIKGPELKSVWYWRSQSRGR